MNLLWESIKMDWAVLTPIFLCSVAVVAVVIQKAIFFKNNKRNIVPYVKSLQKELARNNLETVENMAVQCGGIIGDVTEEAVRIFSKQKGGFSRSFDLVTALSVRKLEKNLTVLGTVGGVAPFLGLFGTVVRILITFQDLAQQGNQSAAVASGIASALIATAFGLGVAIVAVVFYNYFQATVRQYEANFQLIKMLFLSFIDGKDESSLQTSSNIAL